MEWKMTENNSINAGFAPIMIYGEEAIRAAIKAFENQTSLQIFGVEFQVIRVWHECGCFGQVTGMIQLQQLIPIGTLL